MHKYSTMLLCLIVLACSVNFGFSTESAPSIANVMVYLKSDFSFPVDENTTDIAKQAIRSTIDNTKKAVLSIDESALIRHDFDTLFCGFSASIASDKIEEISKLPSVLSVGEIGFLMPAGVRTNGEMVNASSLYSLKDANGNAINGRDILIGVIDSGIDYRHNDLGNGAFGPNSKVAGGKNFVNPDSPPIDDDIIGHGTSVAGLIAADSNKYQGVAPGSRLMSYKVYSNRSMKVMEDVVAFAIQQAVKDKCKIINVSLSNPDGDTSKLSLAASAADAAVKAGSLVVGAAGDFGTNCEGISGSTVGGAGVAENAVCVGSMDMRPGFRISVEGQSRTIFGLSPSPYLPFDKADKMILIDGGYGTDEELSKLTLLNKFVLVKRGPEEGEPLPFFKKILGAKKRGAAGVIVWNNRPGETIQMSVGFNSATAESIKLVELAPSCFITNSDGLYLLKLIESGEVKLSVKEEDSSTITRQSSIGPTKNLVFKPDVSAPGVGLAVPISISALEQNSARYSNSFSGSSASAGMVSGASALLMQKNPSWSPSDIRLALMNTSKIAINPSTSEPSSFLIQGAGVIDVAAAASTPSIVSPGGLILTKNNASSAKLTFKGMGASATYKVRFEVYSGLSNFVSFKPSSEAIQVPASGESNFEFSVDFNPATIPWNIECAIFFESDKATLHVPVICWKDFASTSKQNVSSIKLTGNSIDYNKKDSKVTIEFGVSMGDKFSFNPFAYQKGADPVQFSARENMISGIQFDLVDGNGDSWTTIKRFENVQYGYYKFDWSGLDAEGISKLPNGSYGIKMVFFENVLQKGTSVMTQNQTSQLIKGTIDISSSNETLPPKIFMNVRPLVPSVDQLFVVNVYVVNARDFSGINLEIEYSKDEIEVVDAFAGRFMGYDRSPLEKDIYIDKESSKVKASIKRSNQTGIDGHGTLLTFYAKALVPAEPIIKFSTLSPTDSKGRFIPHMSYPLELVIKEEPPLLGDLNYDGLVNIDDYFIFAQSFGAKRGDLSYNLLADFNLDGLIDNEDLKVLMSNFGKSE